MKVCEGHDWKETKLRRPHVLGWPVRYVVCEKCDQVGFRRGESVVVYTWEQGVSNEIDD